MHNLKLDNADKKIRKLQNDFKDLFNNNKEIKNILAKVHLKEGAQITQQKGTQITKHLQEQVTQELKRLIKHGYLEWKTEITEHCIVSPAVITEKKVKSVNFDFVQKRAITKKRKTLMPNMEELISRLSKKISEGTEGENFATKTRLELRIWAD